MPKGRMLMKKISYDEAISRLSLEASLLYTWTIPHLDVEGRIYANPSILKGTIMPYRSEFTDKVIDRCLKEMEEQGLVLIYGNSHKYMEFKGFSKNQTLTKNKEADSVIPSFEEYSNNSGATPDQLQSNSPTSKVKISKVKISKDIMLSKLNLEEPILYLNEKAKRTFDPKNQSSQALIRARYNEGRVFEDFKRVIDKKVRDWISDDKMHKYLRPSTLFNQTNFENYLNEPEEAKGGELDEFRKKWIKKED